MLTFDCFLVKQVVTTSGDRAKSASNVKVRSFHFFISDTCFLVWMEEDSLLDWDLIVVMAISIDALQISFFHPRRPSRSIVFFPSPGLAIRARDSISPNSVSSLFHLNEAKALAARIGELILVKSSSPLWLFV